LYNTDAANPNPTTNSNCNSYPHPNPDRHTHTGTNTNAGCRTGRNGYPGSDSPDGKYRDVSDAIVAPRQWSGRWL
jgi:hypothetical protein